MDVGARQDGEYADLYAFVQPNETATQLLLRCQQERLTTGVFLIDGNAALRPGQLLEICGPSGCGKTEILTQAAVQFLIGQVASVLEAAARPDAPPRLPPGRRLQRHVVYVDLDGKFDGLKLVQTLIARLEGMGLQVNDWEEDVFRCFHLVRCASSAEWLATLAALPGTLRQLAPGVARLLLVDNTAAFLYQDRANRGPMFGGAATVCGQPPLSLQRVHTAAAAMIQALSRSQRMSVITSRYTSVAPVEQPDGSLRLTAKETLPAAWQQAVTHRLVLHPALSNTSAALYAGCLRGVAQWQQGGMCRPMAPFVVTLDGFLPEY